MKLWPFARKEKALNAVPGGRGGWWPVMESFAGAWQRNVVVDREGIVANPFVFRCQSMIARDISKLRPRTVAKGADGVWRPAGPLPVLTQPNGYQTRNQFYECWMLSKLMRGNTYVLQTRDGTGKVIARHVLDPNRVQPLVSDDGEVFYRLSSDNLAGLTADIVVPATEIIHDRWNCLFHPLVGLSPLWATAVVATQAQAASETAAAFFQNRAQPGGILTAPGKISPETAERLKEQWTTRYSGGNAGKTAVLGEGLTFSPVMTDATDAQLVEQLKWTAETIATSFGVPLYKVGLGVMPTANNLQALNVEYYSQALQALIEDAESCLDLASDFDGEARGIEFEIDGLLRMDSATQMDVLEKGRSVMQLNERRARLDLPPIEGGNTIYLQQQDHSIEAIAARDRQLIAGPKEPPAPPPADPPDQTDKALGLLARKMMGA